jgi:hypothetical protein
MQAISTNRIRVFTDEEIDGTGGPHSLTESEVSNVSGGLIWHGINPLRPVLPFPLPEPTCPPPSPLPDPFPRTPWNDPWINPFNQFY